MGHWGPAGLALAIATVLASLELITAKYPRTFFLLRKAPALYAYAFIYGLIALGVTLGLTSLIEAGAIKLEGLGLSSSWVQAIAVGLAIKAFLHIRLFSVGVGSQSFPVGIETLVQLFEPWLLRSIELDHFNAVREFIGARATKYSTLAQVQATIASNVPQSLPAQERAAFLADVQRAANVIEAMELYLIFLGRRSFDRVFPS